MPTVAQVVEVESGGKIKVNAGGKNNTLTVEQWQDPGTDAPPLPGDYVALTDGPGTGERQAVGSDDGTQKKAAGGENRIYGRDANGALVSEVWLKGDGSIEITSLKSGAKVTITTGGVIEINGASDFVALAQLVLAQLNDIRTKHDSHTHITTATVGASPTPGVIAPPTTPMGPASSVAAVNLKTD